MFAQRISRNAFDIRLLKAERNLDNIIQLSDDFAYWDGQELANAVALATSSALALGRNVAGLTYGDYTPGVNWANPSGQIARHTAGNTATIQQDGVIAAGKTWQYPVIMSNRTAGSVAITGGDVSVNSNGTTIVTITAIGADVIVTPTSDFDGDIDLAQGTVKQTDIAASRAFPGAEKYVIANAASDPAGNEADTTTFWDKNGAEVLLTSDSAAKQVGNYSIKGVFFVNGNAISYDLDLILDRGKRYHLVFGTRHLGSGDAVGVGLALGKAAFPDAPFVTLVNTDTTFQTIDAEFVHTADVRYLNAREASTPSDGGVYFDNISIKEAAPTNGDYTGVTLGQPGNAQVPVMVEYGGAADYTDVSGAEFNSILDPTEFALSIIVQKDTWDAAERYFFSHTVDSDNWIRCGGTSTIGQLVWEVRAGGTTEQITLTPAVSPTDEFHMGIQVKSGTMSAIYRGEIIATEAVAGTFAGNFDTMIIGAKNDTPNNVHLGKLAYHVHSTNKSATQWLREAKAAGAI